MEPTKRVFHIDVGEMPEERKQQYLEAFKKEMEERRQKQLALLDDAILIYRLDCREGGKHQTLTPEEYMEGYVYNPLSQVEDFFFPNIKK